MDRDRNPEIEKLAPGIFQVDSFYLDRRAYTACYLVEKNGEIAIVETNTNHAVPIILKALKQLGYRESQVKYVMITHVHLDHAGGAGELIHQLPEARLVAHSRGARHMVHPEKLVASVKGVYGEEEYSRLYGNIRPVPGDRVVGIQDLESVSLGEVELQCLETPGHANHHMVVVDPGTRTVFSGDAFGIGYPRFNFNGRRLIFPSTAPVQFDPEMARASYDRISKARPQRVLLTHFGQVTDIRQASDQLHQWIDAMVELAGKRFGEGKRDQALSRALTDDLWAYSDDLVKRHRGRALDADEREFLALDINLNAMGLAVYIQKASS